LSFAGERLISALRTINLILAFIATTAPLAHVLELPSKLTRRLDLDLVARRGQFQHHDAHEPVLANGIVRGPHLERHLVVGAEIERLDVPPGHPWIRLSYGSTRGAVD